MSKHAKTQPVEKQPSEKQSTAKLWHQLSEAGLTDGTPVKSDTSSSPWFVKLILAFSGSVSYTHLTLPTNREV